MAWRQTLLLPWDDLLAVTREVIHEGVSRSGLDRCRRRHDLQGMYLHRLQTDRLLQLARNFSVFVVTGARQVVKTTLV